MTGPTYLLLRADGSIWKKLLYRDFANEVAERDSKLADVGPLVVVAAICEDCGEPCEEIDGYGVVRCPDCQLEHDPNDDDHVCDDDCRSYGCPTRFH